MATSCTTHKALTLRCCCCYSQRVYGVTFPDKKLMADYKHRMEEAKKRDHRRLGTQQELFFFNPLSPGSCFFMPNGARVYNTLIEVPPACPAPVGVHLHPHILLLASHSVVDWSCQCGLKAPFELGIH